MVVEFLVVQVVVQVIQVVQVQEILQVHLLRKEIMVV
jgi:hypothetical protein